MTARASRTQPSGAGTAVSDIGGAAARRAIPDALLDLAGAGQGNRAAATRAARAVVDGVDSAAAAAGTAQDVGAEVRLCKVAQSRRGRLGLAGAKSLKANSWRWRPTRPRGSHELGKLVSMRDEGGRTWRFVYDSQRNRVVSLSRSCGYLSIRLRGVTGRVPAAVHRAAVPALNRRRALGPQLQWPLLQLPEQHCEDDEQRAPPSPHVERVAPRTQLSASGSPPPPARGAGALALGVGHESVRLNSWRAQSNGLDGAGLPFPPPPPKTCTSACSGWAAWRAAGGTSAPRAAAMPSVSGSFHWYSASGSGASCTLRCRAAWASAKPTAASLSARDCGTSPPTSATAAAPRCRRRNSAAGPPSRPARRAASGSVRLGEAGQLTRDDFARHRAALDDPDDDGLRPRALLLGCRVQECRTGAVFTHELQVIGGGERERHRPDRRAATNPAVHDRLGATPLLDDRLP